MAAPPPRHENDCVASGRLRRHAVESDVPCVADRRRREGLFRGIWSAPLARAGARADNRTCITINMNDWPIRIDPEEAAIGRPTQDGAPPGRGLRQPEHTPGLRRRAPAARRLARRPAAPRCDAGRLPSPSCTTPGALPRAPRWRSPRRASVRSSPGGPFPPASGRPGCSPGTGGPPAIGDEDRRGRSGSRIWRPSSPPATDRGGESDQVALGARASRCGDRRTAVHGGDAA